MSDLNISGPVMVGLNGEVPLPVQVDAEGRLLVGSGGAGSDPIAVEGTKSPEADLYYSADFVRAINIMYAWSQTAGNYKRLNVNVNDNLKVSNDGDGIQGTGMNPPAGGSGIIGFLSGIFNTLTALIARTRTAFNSGSSGTITLGGTAQYIFSGNATRNFVMIQNISSADLWVAIGTVAAIDVAGNIKLPPNDKLIFDYVAPSNSISIIGGTTGQKYTVING